MVRINKIKSPQRSLRSEAERGKEKSKRGNPQSDRARTFLEKEGERGGSIYRSRSQPITLVTHVV